MNTHWKKLTNTDYIGTYSLDPGKDLTVTIKSVTKQVVKGPDGKQEECIVAVLEGQKPMILNRTNCKMISKLYGTPYIEEWSGKKITLYAAKVRAFGEQVDALRIRDKVPELETLTPTHPKWEAARSALKSGQVTMEKLEQNYKISADDKKRLTSV